MRAMYRHEDMLKINHDRGVFKRERRRDEANTRVRMANDASRRMMSQMTPERAAAIRFKRGLEARERDRPRYNKMAPHKLMAARVFHQLYLLTIRKRKRAIDVFREFDLDDSGTIDRDEFAAGCKSLGMNLGKVAERDVFDAIDEDKSGELDYWEVEKAIKRAGKYPPPYPEAETTGVKVALDGHQDMKDNVVAAHFTDMREGFRAILKFKNKLAKSRATEKAKQAARIQALKTGQGASSSSSESESDDSLDDNDDKEKKTGAITIDGNAPKSKAGDIGDDDKEEEEDYEDDDYEDEFEADEEDENYEDDDDFEEETGTISSSLTADHPVRTATPHEPTNSDDEKETPEYTLKDLAGWVNTDDPTALLDHPELARQLAAVPEPVRRVAGKLRNLMKRERLGIKTMFDCLDVSGNGKLEVHELHEGLMAYLDVDLSLEDLKEVLDHCDKEMDGSISFKEFENAFLWADLKRQSRLIKRQNHADRKHCKAIKRQRRAIEKFRAESKIYRVPEARPLPTKEEAAHFPDGRPRKLPFWLRPRDSPHSRPWKRTIPLGGNISDLRAEAEVPTNEVEAQGGTWQERDRQNRMRRHLERKAAMNVKTPRIKTYPKKFPAWQEEQREKLRLAKEKNDAKLLKRRRLLQLHTRQRSPDPTVRKKTTLPPEDGMPIMPPRITDKDINEDDAHYNNSSSTNEDNQKDSNKLQKGANASVLRALARRRQRQSVNRSDRKHSTASSRSSDAAAMVALSSSPAGRRMLDAVAQYSMPPLLYGAAPDTLSGEYFTPTEKPVVGSMVIAKRNRKKKSPDARKRHTTKTKYSNKQRGRKRITSLPPTPYAGTKAPAAALSSSPMASTKSALVSALRAVATLEDKVNAQHFKKSAEQIFNFRVVRVDSSADASAATGRASTEELRPSTAHVGEDGVRTHMASWNPTLVGVQVSPADEDKEVTTFRSPYMGGGSNKKRVGKLVMLTRASRKKLLKKRDLRKRLNREVSALRRIHATETNGLIQRIVAVLALPQELVLVKTCPQGGTLRQMLEGKKMRSNRALGENPVRFYAAEILLAIEYIHKKGIVHRDIKLENISLSSDGHIVLDGFGLALPDFAGVETEIVGTPQCMAPEMILGVGYGRAVDWWGLGVMIYEMLHGESPFNGESPEELFQDITTGRTSEEEAKALKKLSSLSPSSRRGQTLQPRPVRLGDRFSDPAQDLVEGLLCRKVSNRLGGTKRGGTFGLRFHSFFANPTLPGDKEGKLAKLALSRDFSGSKNYPQPIDWAKLRHREVPPPFVVASHARAAAATSAYSTAKNLGWSIEDSQEAVIPRVDGEGQHAEDANQKEGERSNSQELGENHRSGIRRASRREGDAVGHSKEEDTMEYHVDSQIEETTEASASISDYVDISRAVTPSSFVPLEYPAPLRVCTADMPAVSGFDVLRPDKGALSRAGTAVVSKQQDENDRGKVMSTRPSTRERAIPFQMQLAAIQLAKTKGHLREEQAAIVYGEAVNELANLQQERLVDKELQSQALLEAEEGVYLSIPDV